MTSAEPTPSRTELRFAVLVLFLAFVANVVLSHVGLRHTVLGPHAFRQAQIGITISEFLQHGVRLAYRTPILGPPWELPIEFPLYQALVAWTVKATGADLEVAGRIISWLFFASALPALYLLLGSAGVRRSSRLLCLAVVLTCPMYIYYSRCVFIESTALSLSLWFLVAFVRWRAGGAVHWQTVAWTCGALAGAVKLTTFFGFTFAAASLTCLSLWRQRGPERLRTVRRDLLAVAVPLAVTAVWTAYAFAIREHNPEAGFLKSHFGVWSFGTVGLRISAVFWSKVAWVVGVAVLSEGGAVAMLVYLVSRRGQHRAVAALGVLTYLVTLLVFSNLYWVHDYYHYASAIFLVGALGIALVELSDALALSGWARAAFVLAVCACQLGAYHGSYFKYQHENTPVPELARVLPQVVAPDQMVVILGEDWDASVPYYAQRRALMLASGRERDTDAIVRSLNRLDPKQVGAVVLHGAFWHDAGLARIFSRFKIGDRPFFFNGQDIGIWVPRDQEARLRDRVDLRGTPTFHVAPEQLAAGETLTLTAGVIERREEFVGFVPLPVRATSQHGFAAADVNGQKVLMAHAISEVVFQVPAGKHSLTGVYGMFDGSWNNGQGSTDGVEFVIVERTSDGKERDLLRRFVQPQAIQTDRGSQPLDLRIETHGGELIFRTLPGPKNNLSFDWAYWGDVQIR